MMRLLVDEAKADVTISNKSGCNVLHIAAQGDKALSVYYFANLKGVDINSRDQRQSTPLHWACFTKSEHALQYLLAVKGVDLEAKEENGFTPLHMAVQSVATLKSTRPVRALLLRGASRTALDVKGRTARDLVNAEIPETLRNDLKSMLVR